MRKLVTVICCICLATTGYFVTHGSSTSEYQQNALHAANIPYWKYDGQLPLDLQLDLAKKLKTDTVVIHDTVLVDNIKYVRVPVPKHTTDTIYVPLDDLPGVEVVAVKNKSPGDREEHTLDEMSSPKQGIVLIVDGNTVYSSKNDIHSGGIQNDSTSVSDEH